MQGMERRGAERMLRAIIQVFKADGQALHAEAARRIGKQVLEQDDSESVFPAAAELPDPAKAMTIKMGKP